MIYVQIVQNNLENVPWSLASDFVRRKRYEEFHEKYYISLKVNKILLEIFFHKQELGFKEDESLLEEA